MVSLCFEIQKFVFFLPRLANIAAFRPEGRGRTFTKWRLQAADENPVIKLQKMIAKELRSRERERWRRSRDREMETIMDGCFRWSGNHV